MSFLFFLWQNQRENRKAEQVLSGELGTSGVGEEVGKVCRRVNIAQYCVHMYANGKMIPIEIIPGMREKGDKGE
jgi:hypothetical protein